MANQTLEREVTELRSKIKEQRGIAAERKAAADKLVEDEKKAGRNLLVPKTDEDRDAFKRVDAAYKEADQVKEYLAELEGNLNWALEHAARDAIDVSDGDPRHPALHKARTIGAFAAEHEVYKDLVESGRTANASKDFRTAMMPVMSRRQTVDFLKGRIRGPVYADAGDGAPLVELDQQLMPPVEFVRRQVRVLDLITILETSKDQVVWTRPATSGRTNNAGTKAFGTALDKSRYQREKVTSGVVRKGHYVEADEGNLTDEPLYRSTIDEDLIPDLRLKIEEDLLTANGNGSSEWEGVLETTGIGDLDGSGMSNADALHHAITAVRVNLEGEPDAFGIDPEDYEDFWLEKGQDGHYLHHRGPQDAQVQSVWGFPAAVSTVFTQPICGNWRRGATLWVREGVAIDVGRIDDQFIEDMWSIKATFRGAFAVKRPWAFCTVSNFES